MLNNRIFAISALSAALAFTAAGCGSQGGKTVITQSPTGEPIMSKAIEDGTYQLFTSMSLNPTVTVKLNAGDDLGFRKNAAGRLEAVAGDQVTEIGKGTAQVYWKKKKD